MAVFSDLESIWFSGLEIFWFVLDLDRSVFLGQGSFGFSDLDQVFRVRILFWFFLGWMSGLSWFRILFGLFPDLDLGVFRGLDFYLIFPDLDLFRLLIQRCKIRGDGKSFFDQNAVLPDERKNCPMKGNGGAIPAHIIGDLGGRRALLYALCLRGWRSLVRISYCPGCRQSC